MDSTEADVREEFVSPLLWQLGYAKETVNDILRHKSYDLPPLFLQIGSSKRIQIDYLNKVMLRNFWVIETKTPQQELQSTDLDQAYFYALHPSVQAPLVVVTNGRVLRVYDVQGPQYDVPIVELMQADAEATFGEIVKVLHAKRIGASIRERTLDSIAKALSVEVDEAVVDDFSRRFNSMIDGARATVHANAKSVTQKSWVEAFNADDIRMRAMSWDELLVASDVVTSLQLKWGHEMGRRLIENVEDRRGMIDDVAKQWRGRPHSIFRVQALVGLLDLYEAGIHARTKYLSSIEDGIEELVAGARTYYGQSALSHELCFLDNDCIRIAYKFVRTGSTEQIAKMLEERRERTAVVDSLSEIQSQASTVITLTGLVAEFVFWRQFAYGDLALVRQGRSQIALLEETIDKSPMPLYSDGDSDLTAYGVYGKGHDMLLMGTWDTLQMRGAFVEASDLSDDVKELARMSHTEAHSFLATIAK
ncbi:MAG TPA: hypothetical protein VFE16_13715 [Candidatus Cybelea sp.]|nr:hypothetical protein [Candidatus Cybelea sp.]